ncbi:MAG TPA: CrcB family protein, partial [Acidimicrobiia bacterium]|nr:CrcB family protein [Acidimicrobiia bacterium]
MWVWVALAGAAGAASRYGVHRAMESRVVSALPWGTIAVNLAGSLALGVVAGLVLHQGVDPDVQVIAGTGFLGAFTT